MARARILLDSDVTSGLNLHSKRDSREQAVSRAGMCQTGGSDGARFAPLRPPRVAEAQPHRDRLSPLLSPRSRAAGAYRGLEVPGNPSEADQAHVSAKHFRNVRLSANAAASAR